MASLPLTLTLHSTYLMVATMRMIIIIIIRVDTDSRFCYSGTIGTAGERCSGLLVSLSFDPSRKANAPTDIR